MLTSAGLATPFRYGGASGCQTDADTGLVLMGHRYYDSRIGRFISQDPAGAGSNQYAYANNDPVDAADPSGLLTQQEAQAGQAAYRAGDPGVYSFYQVTNGDYGNAKYLYSVVVGFNSDLNPSGGTFGGPMMNFPGGADGLKRDIGTAEQLKKDTTHHFPNAINLNAQGYQERLSLFKDLVHGPDKKTGKSGPWDFKAGVDRVKNPLLFDLRRNAGDFWYGAGGTIAGIGPFELQFGAGVAQFLDDSPKNAFSYWQTGFDDPEGHGEALAGMDWWNSGARMYSVSVPSR